MKQTIRAHYHWIVAAAAFLMIAVVLGLANNLFSLFVIPVTRDLGVSRGAFSVMPSIKAVATFASTLALGALYCKFGFRRLALFSMLLLSLSYVGFSRSGSMVPFYLGAAVNGFCEPFCSTAAVSHLVGDWFDRHRGAVLGTVLAASGLGASLLTVVLSGVIETRGWRAAYLLAGILIAAAAVLVVLAVRDTPKKLGLRPLGAGEPVRRTVRASSRIQDWEGFPMKRLLRMPCFHIVILAMFLIGVSSLGVFPILAAHLQDRGMSASFSAAMLSLMFLMLAVAKIVVGFLLDRFGAKPVMLLCAACNVVGLVLLSQADTVWEALAYVLIFPFALCMQTVTLPGLAADLFGRHSYSAVLSLMLALIALSGAVSSPLINFSYDLRGSYSPILLVMAAVAACILALLLIGFRGAARARKKLEQNEKKEEAAW